MHSIRHYFHLLLCDNSQDPGAPPHRILRQNSDQRCSSWGSTLQSLRRIASVAEMPIAHEEVGGRVCSLIQEAHRWQDQLVALPGNKRLIPFDQNKIREPICVKPSQTCSAHSLLGFRLNSMIVEIHRVEQRHIGWRPTIRSSPTTCLGNTAVQYKICLPTMFRFCGVLETQNTERTVQHKTRVNTA